MLFCCIKYLNHFLLKSVLSIGFIFAFAIAASAQIRDANIVGSHSGINPLLLAAFKKPVKPINPNLTEYLKPRSNEIICFSAYPLSLAQIEARNREWERRNKQTLGGQIVSDIANDIIKTQINSLIYGKKPVAAVPKF